MRLAQVPKMLSLLRNEWAPMAFHISFKVGDHLVWVGKATKFNNVILVFEKNALLVKKW